MIYNNSKPMKNKLGNQLKKILTITMVTCTSLIFFSTTKSAIAHHPMGAKMPANLWEGLLSGMGHPIIGIDHLSFVVGVGLIAAGMSNRISILASFIATAILGTVIHILSIDLPLAEIAIAISVVVLGAMLALKQKLNTPLLIIFAAIAGIFHGYAYGEAIIGAEMTPLLAYLMGFTVIQLFIALLAMKFAELASNYWQNQLFSLMRFLALAIISIGAVFFLRAVFS